MGGRDSSISEGSVLVLTDSSYSRTMSRNIVQRSNFDVDIVSSLEQFEKLLKNDDFDCIVVDRRFSEYENFRRKMSGMAFKIPSIALNLESELEAKEAFENGFDEVLTYSGDFKYDLLVRRIESLISTGSFLEKNVFQGNELIESVFESAPVGIYLQDADGTVLVSNNQIKEMGGFEPHDLTGQGAENSPFTVDQIERFREADRKALNGETVEIPEVKLETNTGETRYFTGIKKGFNPEGTDRNFILGTLIDITDRKEKEEALEQILEVSESISTAKSRREIGEIAVDAIKNILKMNVTAFFEKQGNSLVPAYQTQETSEKIAELPKLSIEDSLAGKVFDEGQSTFYENLEEQGSNHKPNTGFKSEVIIPLGVHGVIVSGSTSEHAFDREKINIVELFCSVVESGMDRAQREDLLRKKEEALRNKNEKLNKFASIVSHDLRNPLNVASGYLDIAENTGDESDFEEVRSALQRIDEIIESVLKMTKDEEDIEITDFSLKDVSQDAWKFIDSKGSTLKISEDTVIYADREQVQNILENLFSNSVKHNETPVTVRVGSTEQGFYVEDDGKGLDLDEDVFEFGRSNSGSTGLGLSIVGDIAERLGWDINLSESREGGLRLEFVT